MIDNLIPHTRNLVVAACQLTAPSLLEVGLPAFCGIVLETLLVMGRWIEGEWSRLLGFGVLGCVYSRIICYW